MSVVYTDIVEPPQQQLLHLRRNIESIDSDPVGLHTPILIGVRMDTDQPPLVEDSSASARGRISLARSIWNGLSSRWSFKS